MEEKILVVDRDANSRAYLRDLLEKQGYEVVVMGDDEPMEEHLASGEIRVVFLDISSRGSHGAGLYKSLKQDYPHLKLILTARRRERNMIKEAIEAGVYGCVYRPYDIDEVLLMVKTLLPHRLFYKL
ncbi:MAG: response regulator [Acidobacteria bacterium]|nr:response regulator [Acidobacteriota bacterium]